VIGHLRWVENVATDTTRAGCRREAFGIKSWSVSMAMSATRRACSLGILARRGIIATEVGRVVASEASLGLHTLRDAVGSITGEHAKAL